MATINFATREILAKVVYCGPQGAGTSTNVRELYNLITGSDRSKLHKFGPNHTEERSWFFEVTEGQPIKGFIPRFRFYSLSGGLELQVHREEVLRDLDGIVFVVDARPEAAEANLNAMMDLESSLNEVGMELSVTTVVLQVNHSDAPQARPLQSAVYDLNPYDFPVIRAIATDGVGILDTFTAIRQELETRIRENLAGNPAGITLDAIHEPRTQSADEEMVSEHIRVIEHATPAQAIVSDATGLDSVGPMVELPFQPPGYSGWIPIRVGNATVEGERITVEVVMERKSDQVVRKIHLNLVNRPPTPRPTHTLSPSQSRGVFDYLPTEDKVFGEDHQSEPAPVWMAGLLGTAAGITISALIFYLVYI